MNLIDKKSNLTKDEILAEARDNGLLLLIDKPSDWTSFDVCAKLRGLVKMKKVGHSGTLDPAATGLLLIGVGRGTKELHELTGMDKVYTGKIKLGAITKTDDGEAEEEDIKSTDHISDEMILEEIKNFIGPLKQKPPKYSAKKIKGKKMYNLAKKGVEFEVKTYDVIVHSFEVTEIELPYISFKIHCGKGTYIRSLARDLGEKLGVGGYLSLLRRTKIADYEVENGFTIEEISNLLRPPNVESI